MPGEASITEEWLLFVNRVAAEVHKEFPQAYIATNGYANRNLPPEGVKLDDHMVIMFAAIWSCTLHGYDDDHCWQKVRQGQMLKRWCALCKNVWIYGYNYNMLVSGLTPFPEFTKLRRDFPLMKKWGVMGFHDESRNVWAEAGIASRYLRAVGMERRGRLRRHPRRLLREMVRPGGAAHEGFLCGPGRRHHPHRFTATKTASCPRSIRRTCSTA